MEKMTLVSCRDLLTKKTVQKQLVRLLAHFPGNGRSIEGLAVIAPDYYEAFRDMTDSQFEQIVTDTINEHGRSFFPTIGELKKANGGYVNGIGFVPKWDEDQDLKWEGEK